MPCVSRASLLPACRSADPRRRRGEPSCPARACAARGYRRWASCSATRGAEAELRTTTVRRAGPALVPAPRLCAVTTYARLRGDRRRIWRGGVASSCPAGPRRPGEKVMARPIPRRGSPAAVRLAYGPWLASAVNWPVSRSQSRRDCTSRYFNRHVLSPRGRLAPSGPVAVGPLRRRRLLLLVRWLLYAEAARASAHFTTRCRPWPEIAATYAEYLNDEST